MISNVDETENFRCMLAGELYFAQTPRLIESRRQCRQAVARFNKEGEMTRREMAKHWKAITTSERPLPPRGATDEEEDAILHEYPYIEAPIRIDYGFNVIVGSDVFINYNCTIIDTCTITIGSRTIFGPNVSLYSGTHPQDPDVRNGAEGPEFGKPIAIGDDCWIGGNAIILAGVTIGNGCTVGAGSVVTKDVPAYHVVVGNPARVLREVVRGGGARQGESQQGPSAAPVPK